MQFNIIRKYVLALLRSFISLYIHTYAGNNCTNKKFISTHMFKAVHVLESLANALILHTNSCYEKIKWYSL
jgi:hypothetical protein